MSALKFDVLDMIREPDNYTSAERAQAAEAITELLSVSRQFSDFFGDLWDLAEPTDEAAGFLSLESCKKYDMVHDRMAAALARFGGAE